MAARVIHFGCDNCYRVQVLRSVGYEVRESASLDDLALALECEEVDAVILSDDDPGITEGAADLVRTKSTAPVILFHRGNGFLDGHKFDRIFPGIEAPTVWLTETAELIATRRALLDVASQLQT